MPSGTNSYAFCADYSGLATCLFAIQTSEENGAFAADAEALKLLRLFEKDVLRKLYLRTLRILGLIDHIDGITGTYRRGDFKDSDFLNKDFNTGTAGSSVTYSILGDFEDDDFTYMDFYVGYLDTRNTRYSSTFQTILNIFREFCWRSDEISETDKAAIDAALIPVLDAINELQQHLTSKGLNPCTAAADFFLNNSSSIYLQAAGADGTDGIPAGLHLRWSLTGELGTNHIPKGNYISTSDQPGGFNQPDDYVQVYRIPYIDPARFNLDFETSRPVVNVISKFWTYTINQTVDNQLVTNYIRLKFTDVSLYNNLASRVDTGISFFEFLQQYTGIIELQVISKSLFTVGFAFGKSADADRAVLKAETLCQAIDTIGSSDPVHTRKTYIVEDDADANIIIVGENIQTIRLKKSPEGILKGFYFESYHDFIFPKPPVDYSYVGSFGLSLTDQEVYDRIETAAYPVDNLWPQYNNGTRVRVSNYHDKWEVSHPNEPSLKEAVSQYLTLSETDPRAEDILRDDDADPDSPGLQISYVDLLNLQSLDYHIARMLGLGHIDVIPETSVNDKFVYIMVYLNRAGLDNSQMITYRYITPPISQSDYLLPETPEIRPVTYGLPVMDTQINKAFDEHGYTTLDDIRAVNIGRQLFSDEVPGYNFFADLFDVNNLNIFERPKPVLYGIEYRSAGQSAYVKPEITQQKVIGTPYYAYDDDYPATGIAETVPVPDDPTSLYIHFENQTGVHFYAIYGINWFARASALSDEIETDATVFLPVNTLVVPTDLAVQYIQQENPLLFTTTIEQNWLNGRAITFPGQDIGFIRLTFNWLDIADVTRVHEMTAENLLRLTKANQVNAFFKPEMPLEIMGIIDHIIPVPGSATQLNLYTVGYELLDGSSSDPRIDNEDLFRFTNSLFSTPEGQFQVIGVLNGEGNWPVITIERAYDTGVIEDDNQPGNYFTKKSYVSPVVNSRFSMIENLSNQATWNPVAENISLISFADPENPVIESSADSEGNITRLWAGGINASAIVTPLFSTAADPDDLPGYYKVSFDTAVLEPNPQINIPFDPEFPDKNAPGTLHDVHVEWYKGWIRMPLASGSTDKKLLEVLRIDQTSPLVLYIYDPAYQDDPINDVTTSVSSVTVNFHPGYRAYLFPEPDSDYTLNGNHILPADDANDKKTLLGLQTADTRSGGSGFVSPVSVPAVLHARKIDEPLQLGTPTSPVLKVRPDATGKAAFTFDVRVAPAANGSLRKPFGFMFYRTTVEDLFDALYSSATVLQITADLGALVSDPSYNQRVSELINLIFDPEHFLQFRIFDAEPQPYGFPVPDRAGLTDDADNATVKIAKYTLAIHQTLMPLTEQTPVYNFIKDGFQTENTLPVIRDINGSILNPADPAFNPFPMVRKYIKEEEPGVTYIRFTDYLLNGSSRNGYFYAGTEMTNQLVPGLLSLFTGPVTILHTLTPDGPVIGKFSILPPVVSAETVTVTFQVSPISIEEHISKIRVFRTTDPIKAANLQLVDTSFDQEIEEGLRAGYLITDNFTDMMVLPLGEVLYYRFVGIRTIINELEEPEDVFSYSSEIIPVRLIDTINPDAPELTYHADTNSLSWLPTANKGTYYLYQQNSKGNWQRIYTVEPPATSAEMDYPLPAPLVLQDEDGNRIYYRFKVQSQNSSGLFNLTENEITI